MTQKPIIAIDGPAASGKGTLARSLAEHLNFAYMDTGILYRGVAFELLSSGLSVKDKKDARTAAQTLIKKIMNAANPNEILGNEKLRDDDISQAASKIAAIQEVRDVLNNLQKDFAKNPGKGCDGAILDGRDIGTVICPEADLKLFITAKIGERAQRRLKELQSKGIAATYSTVLEDMRERDLRDIERNSAPMAKAEDAVFIDSSKLDANDILIQALQIVKERLDIII